MAMTGGTSYLLKSAKTNRGNNNWAVSLYLYVVQTSQSVENNTTTLKLGMYIRTPGSGYSIDWTDFGGSDDVARSYIGIAAYNGGSQQKSTFKHAANGSGTIWLVENVEVTVKHASNGTCSAAPIIWRWAANSPWGQYIYPQGTYTIELPAIPRASTITSASDVALGKSTNGTCSITVSRKSSNYYHTATITCGSKSKTTARFATSTNVSIPYSWLSEFPNDPYKNATVSVQTYASSSSSTRIGSAVTKTIKIKAGSSVAPSTPTLSYQLVKAFEYAEDKYCLIQGKSQVKLSASGLEANGDASLISCTFQGQNISGTKSTYTVSNPGSSASKTSSILQAAGRFKYSVQTKDSREISSATVSTDSLTVYAYSKPVISSLSIKRSNDTTAKVTATIKYTTIATNNYNALTSITNSTTHLVSCTSAAGTVSLSTVSDITIADHIATVKYTYTITGLTTNSQPKVTIKVRDQVMKQFSDTAITKSKTVPAPIRIINIAKDGKGIAIGGLSSGGSKFETKWPIVINSEQINNKYLSIFRPQPKATENSTAHKHDVNAQFYIGDTGATTITQRYKLPSETEYSTGAALRLYEDEVTISKPLDVTGSITATSGRFTSTTNVSATANNNVALRVGTTTANHLDIDGNEIQAKQYNSENKAATAGALYLNHNGGSVYVNGNKVLTTANFRKGTCTLNPNTETTVTFTSSMGDTPRVMLTPLTQATGVVNGKVHNATASGFTAIIGGTSPASAQFAYLAYY